MSLTTLQYIKQELFPNQPAMVFMAEFNTLNEKEKKELKEYAAKEMQVLGIEMK